MGNSKYLATVVVSCLLFPVLPAVASATVETACSPRRADICASFDGQRIWLSEDRGQTWRMLVDLNAPETTADDEDGAAGEDAVSEAPLEAPEETFEAEETEEDTSLDFSDALPPSESAEPDDPQSAPSRGERRVCVSDDGHVALVSRKKVSVWSAAGRGRSWTVREIRSCEFDAMDQLLLFTGTGAMRLDPRNGSWRRVDANPSDRPVRGLDAMLGPYRAAARRDEVSCPNVAAGLLPRVRLLLQTHRARREVFESDGTLSFGLDWAMFVGIWLDLRLPHLGPPKCALRRAEEPWRRPVTDNPVPSPTIDLEGLPLDRALEAWEHENTRRALNAALANGVDP